MSEPTTADEHQPPPPQQQQQPPNCPPQFLKSINDLVAFAAAITEFKSKFDELQNHIDFITKSIDDIQHNRTTSSPTAVAEKSELQILCETMNSKGLRKYLITNLSNTSNLREQVPPLLKCAPNPARLVLDCIGRFFLQGSKAYTKQSPMVPGREASVLVLECFLLVIDDGVEIEVAVKQEAEQAALAWRKRLVAEGGLGSAFEIDARGLLLLIGCYGIPKGFKNEDVWNLARVSGSRMVGEALRRSCALVKKVSEIIEGMMKNGMKLEAADVASTFGLEDKFPTQEILSSFLHQSQEALKRRKREANNSPRLLKEANERQLAALRTVMKFLEDHKLDPTKLLPGSQVKENIVKLEKEITDLKKKIDDKVMAKRKADEKDISNNLKSQEAKRARFTATSGIGLHDQRAIIQVDGKSTYGASQINLLDGGYSNYVNHYPSATSVLFGTGGGSLPENVLGLTAGGGGVMHAAGVGLAAVYGGPSTSSLAGVQGEMLVDRAGQILGNNGASHVFSDRSMNQSFSRQPSSGMFVLSPSIEGFAGLPNSPPTGAAIRSTASDLYRFADAVVEGEYDSSRVTVPLPPVVGPHHSSYV